MHRRQCVRSISRMSCSVRCFCRLISSPDILISGIIVAELNWTELLVILTVWNKSKHWYKGTRAHCGYEKSRKTLSCHCADWVHKAGMLIVACSGLRSSIIQQTGLFSIQSVFLLVVMVVVVEVEWEDWGEGNNYSTPHRAHTHTHTFVQRPQTPISEAASWWIIHQRRCRARWCSMGELVSSSVVAELDMRGEERKRGKK